MPDFTIQTKGVESMDYDANNDIGIYHFRSFYFKNSSTLTKYVKNRSISAKNFLYLFQNNPSPVKLVFVFEEDCYSDYFVIYIVTITIMLKTAHWNKATNRCNKKMSTCYRAYFPHLGFPGFPTTHS